MVTTPFTTGSLVGCVLALCGGVQLGTWNAVILLVCVVADVGLALFRTRHGL